MKMVCPICGKDVGDTRLTIFAGEVAPRQNWHECTPPEAPATIRMIDQQIADNEPLPSAEVIAEIEKRHKYDDIETGTWRTYQAGEECHNDRATLLSLLRGK